MNNSQYPITYGKEILAFVNSNIFSTKKLIFFNTKYVSHLKLLMFSSSKYKFKCRNQTTNYLRKYTYFVEGIDIFKQIYRCLLSKSLCTIVLLKAKYFNSELIYFVFMHPFYEQNNKTIKEKTLLFKKIYVRKTLMVLNE